MKIKIPQWTIPIALLFVSVVSFGLLIPRLGFFLDDWPVIYTAHHEGTQALWQLALFENRPYYVWIYLIGFPILGFSPVKWQLFLLIIRWLTSVVFWACFRRVWPKNQREVAWAAVLFVIYPIFIQQASAVTYSQHWVSYLLFMVSLFAMIQSIRLPRLYVPFTVLSMVTAALQLVTVEYFFGIELVRPFVIYILLTPGTPVIRRRILDSMKLWLPNFIVLAGFAIWRVRLMPNPGFDRNTPQLLINLLGSPLPTTFDLAQKVLQDFFQLIVATWYKIFDPELLNLQRSANMQAILIAIVVGAVLYLYFQQLNISDGEAGIQSGQSELWSKFALIFGAFATIVGPIPVWLIDRQVYNGGTWSDRFGLASMMGASILLVAFLKIVVEKRKVRTILLCLMVGFSVAYHINKINDYRWSWVKQSRFYWEMYWRAPYIQPGTAIISDGEIFNYMGLYPTSLAINTVYPKEGGLNQLNYWYYSIPKDMGSLETFLEGKKLDRTLRSLKFIGYSKDALVIYYEPDESRCLWVVRPEDKDNREVPGISREALALSNLNRILRDSPMVSPPPSEIFGPEPVHNWCYYFQKSDLARQYGEWKEVVELWKEAETKGLRPKNGVEFVPFIEAFAHQGDWKTAALMTARANQLTAMMPPFLCPVWQRLDGDTSPSSEKTDAKKEVLDLLSCPG